MDKKKQIIEKVIEKIEYAIAIEQATKYGVCHIDPESLQFTLVALKEKYERMKRDETKRK